MIVPKVYGLKDYTTEEIKELTKIHPRGYHKTHKRSGEKLPYNGVFYSQKPTQERDNDRT